jgi:hypothetical protein
LDYQKTLDAVSEFYDDVKLNVFLMTSGSRVVRQEQVALNKLYKKSSRTSYPSTYGQTLLSRAHEVDKSFIMSPRFASAYSSSSQSTRYRSDYHGRGGCCDTLLVPYKTVVEQGDLEEVTEVRFSFLK